MQSITLQAICDYKKKFIDVFTGAPGKIHDSRVFALSDISKELPLICENKYHIIIKFVFPGKNFSDPYIKLPIIYNYPLWPLIIYYCIEKQYSIFYATLNISSLTMTTNH